jgi:hypothetical protein
LLLPICTDRVYSYVQNKRLFQIACSIEGMRHAKRTNEGKSRSDHVM